jgi:hypothetical protein
VNPAPSLEITERLHAWSAGDQDTYHRIVETVYPELRNIAPRCLGSEHPEHMTRRERKRTPNTCGV